METVNREEFLQILESVKPGLATKEVMEQSNCFIFEGKYVYTFNDDIACFHRVSLDLTGAVPAEPLLNLLNKMTEDEIKIDQQDGELIIKGKKKSAGIRWFEQIELDLTELEKPQKGDWTDLAPEFTEAVSIAESCVSTVESDFTLSSIHITPEYIESCDTKQAVRYCVETGAKKSFLVRHGHLKQIIALGMTKIAETKSWIHFKNDFGLIVSCRRYVEEYSDQVERVFARERKGVGIQFPSSLVDATEKADIFAKASTNGVEDEIQITLSDGLVELYGTGALGWYKEKRGIEYEGESFSFMIGPTAFSSMVSRYKECILCKDCLKVIGSNFEYITSIRK